MKASPATSSVTPPIRIGLVNNMPDPALEATELQFAALLRDAVGAPAFSLDWFAMPQVPRGEAAARRIAAAYRPWDDIWRAGLDALIVTGAEPRTARLDQESYWQGLVGLIDWAKSAVLGSVWSCLAAHAAVLHLDRIERARLADKCFGVFAHDVDGDHALTRGTPGVHFTPHSRWNEIPAAALEANGYRILARSAHAGANLFAKDFGGPFVFWQGHPEYEERTLLKEYQRDVIRFLRCERDTYPSPPAGYFDATVTARMSDFRQLAEDSRGEALTAAFPFEAAAARLRNSWRATALRIYGNWLREVAAAKAARMLRPT